MHRSGTSVVSRMLSMLGADLGPERSTMAPAADNPKGYWEHSGLVEINIEILSRFGGTWDNPPDFPEGWPTSPQVQDFRQRAQEIIKGDFSDAPLWSWKDPRCSVTLPFWQHVMPSMSYIVCVRNPVSVSRSLERRDGFSMHKSAALWLKYTASAVRYTSGRRRLLVFYEDVMQNWEVELDRLATFVGTRASINEASVREIRQFLEPELYHHRNKVLTAVNEPQLSLPVKSLYLVLLQARHSTLPDRMHEEITAAIDVFASKAVRREFHDELASETQTVLRAELIESQRQNQSLAFERDSLQHEAAQQRLSSEQALASQSNRLLARVASARLAASAARNNLRIE